MYTKIYEDLSAISDDAEAIAQRLFRHGEGTAGNALSAVVNRINDLITDIANEARREEASREGSRKCASPEIQAAGKILEEAANDAGGEAVHNDMDANDEEALRV